MIAAVKDTQGTAASNAQGGTKKMTAKSNPIAAKRGIGLSALLALLGLAVLLLATSASAKVIHEDEGSFDGSDAPSGPLLPVIAVAVDNSGGPSDGAVWAGDGPVTSPGGTVVKFDEDGVYAGVEFTGSETPAGTFFFLDFGTFAFSDPLVVDSSAGANSGDLFVVEAGNKVIDRFGEDGTYECQITGKAAPSPSECAGGASPTPSGGMTPADAAVSPLNGHLYVADAASKKIYEFNEAGEYVAEIADASITEPASLDFDSAGNFYVVNGSAFFGGVNVVKLDPTGSFEATLTSSGSPIRVSVDRGLDRVFVSAESGAVREFDPAGNELSSFGSSDSISLATNSTSNEIYVATSGSGRVDIWGRAYSLPDVVTNPATAVEETTATLHGEVDPDTASGGTEVESCEFEYGTTTAYGDSVPCSPATPYGAPQVVTGAVTGLQDSTKYNFRIKASNENGIESFGANQTFITKGPPTVDDQSVSGITRFTANLEAEVNPHGYSTDVVFEYVDQAQYNVDGFNSAQTTAPVNVGSAETPQAAEAEATGLEVETTYHFRAIAESSHGEDTGPDESFDTQPVAEIEAQYAVVLIHRAKLEVDVNPLGLDTTCHAQYVSDADFQGSGYANATTIPCEPEGLGEGTERVTGKAYLEGLDLTKLYHYRFVLQNSSGTVVGEDKEFIPFGITEFAFEALEETEFEEPRPGPGPWKVHPVNPVPVTQAGAHPWVLRSKIEMSSTTYREDTDSITGLIKDILTELPPGLVGDPEAVPKCRQRAVEEDNCSGDSHVGRALLWYGKEKATITQRQTANLYNTVPPKGKAARFGGEFNISTYGFIDAGIRTGGDYGVDAGATNLTNTVALRGVEVRLWGVPADPSHFDERRCPGISGPCESNAQPPKPFLRLPTHCDGQPLKVGAKVDSFNAPGEFVHASTELPALTGCEKLEFAPSIEARPTTDDSDSPTGLHVSIENPQNEDPEGLGTPDVRDVEVTLPEGLTVNPASANGLEGCSESEADLKSTKASKCPDGSRVGRATVNTPLLDHPLEGGVYVAEPYDNPFDSLIALYIALDDPQSGVIVKLAGEVEVDEDTGQLSASFSDNPQLPFDSFEVDFFGGALAPLKTPAACGTYTVESKLTPWSAPDTGPAEEPTDSWKIDDGPGSLGCASSERSMPNAPAFSAGTQAPIAAAYSPFVVNLARADGTQQLRDVTVTPPPGLVAKLAGTPYCPEAALAEAAGNSGNEEEDSPSCPAASEIGSVHVSAGAGPAPYHVMGTAYLAGPYKGAPLSLAIITPATAGPFDLGTVVVRAALHVNPETTQITAVADPVPEILEGIPLNVRSVSVRMDKPGFARNPSSCDPSAVNGQLLSTTGSLAALISRFQVGDCTNLDFGPKLGLRLFGKTNRGAHPAFRAVLGMGEGANITRAAIRLPGSEILDQGHIRTICTRVQFAASVCPPGSVYGYAKAWSPLLDAPLQGPVYLRSSDNELPDLVADLHGQVHIVVVGRIDSVNGGIRNTFETVPDAPVSKFMLTMKGGNKGLLQNSTNICLRTNRARAAFDAHNGAVADLRPALRNKRCARQKRKAAAKRRAAKRRAKRQSLASLASASKVATP